MKKKVTSKSLVKVSKTDNKSKTKKFNFNLIVILVIVILAIAIACFFIFSRFTGLVGEGFGAFGTSLNLNVTNVSSSIISLQWDSVTGASGYKIYIAPEPGLLSDNNHRLLITTVSSSVLNYKITNISAATDVFIRVEAVGTSTFEDIYARTIGGPNTNLDPISSKIPTTFLKEVHLMAPNILMLVYEDKHVKSYIPEGKEPMWNFSRIENYTGHLLQNGTWNIKRLNGSSFQVKNIYRHSTIGGQYNDWPTEHADVNHNVYIVLNENVGNHEILNISGPLGIKFALPFSDKFLETPVIQVNQIAYSPVAKKRYAYISGWLGDGKNLSLANFPTKASVLVESQNPLVNRSLTLNNLDVRIRYIPDTTNCNASGLLTWDSGRNLWCFNGTYNNGNGSGPIIYDCVTQWNPVPSQFPQVPFDCDAGTQVREINLSALPTNDTAIYHVYISGVGVSWKTQVSDLALFKAMYVIGRGTYYNRWARDLQPQWTNFGPRPPDYHSVYQAELYDSTTGRPTYGFSMFPEDQSTNVPRVSITEGYHDAGDWDQQPFHYNMAVDLFVAYELNPSVYRDSQWTIPESGNKIPDILDSALWELGVWEELQEVDGGIRAGVESYRHPYGMDQFADEDPLPYFTYSVVPGHTARVAGAFAMGARLVQQFNQSEYLNLKNRAILAYDYAKAHGVNESSGGTLTFASSELYKLTGEQKYRIDFEKTIDYACDHNEYCPNGGDGIISRGWCGLTSMNVNNEPQLCIGPEMVVGYLQSSDLREGVGNYSYLLNELTDRANALHAIIDTKSHRTIRPGGLGWGTGASGASSLMPEYSRLLLDSKSPLDVQTKQDYLDDISLSTDYLLGGNPAGMTWITVLGSQFPVSPQHDDNTVFVSRGQGLLPGITVFGPIGGNTTHGNSYYYYTENAEYPPIDATPQLRNFMDGLWLTETSEGGASLNINYIKMMSLLINKSYLPPVSWLPWQEDQLNPMPTQGTIDYSSPSIPQGLHVSVLNHSAIGLSWSASSEAESKLLWYNVYRNGNLVSHTGNYTDKTSFVDVGLDEGTTYTYNVSAVNIVFLESSQSVSSTGSTPLDLDKPTLSDVSVFKDYQEQYSFNKLLLTFSEPITKLSAEDVSHYSLTPSVGISSAVLLEDNRSVILTTSSSLTVLASYTLTYSSILDRSKTGNVGNGNYAFKYASDSFVYNCSTIYIPGQYILVNSTIRNYPNTCINVYASNVTLSCNNLLIDGLDLGNGIKVGDVNTGINVNNVTIKHCKINDFNNGFDLERTWYSYILDSSVTSAASVGVNIWSSSFNTIYNVNSSGNNIGIFINDWYGQFNDLSYGLISNNVYGIELGSPFIVGNHIRGFKIINNSVYGIKIDDFQDSDNIIYDNFFNNTNNINPLRISGSYPDSNYSVTKTPGTNIVGGGYVGGNFWAQPSGNGFSQKCGDSNKDGICDTSFNVSSGLECIGMGCKGFNIDEFPLSAGFVPVCVDFDHDGYNVSMVGCGVIDCDDSDLTIKPRAIEICDGKDNNCDGSTDEGCVCTSGQIRQCGTSAIGECKLGNQSCNAGTWSSCVGNVEPTTEICDSKDNNCDGQTDESNVCGVTNPQDNNPGSPGGPSPDTTPQNITALEICNILSSQELSSLITTILSHGGNVNGLNPSLNKVEKCVESSVNIITINAKKEQLESTKGFEISLPISWRIKFPYNNINHTLTLNNITNHAAKFGLKSNLQLFDLTVGNNKETDLNGDGKNELNVLIKSMSNYSVVVNLKIIQPIILPLNNTVNTTGNETGEIVVQQSRLFYWWLIIVLVIVIVFAAVILILLKLNSKRKVSQIGVRKSNVKY
ncbi:MAG: glycoside hydrolase family 9 protein [Candidatus Pacearchaeota archaeon]|jgi:hypothetical protein